MVGLGRRSLGAAALLALSALPGAMGELDACLSALAQLLAPPYNMSLPYMNGVSGSINVAYAYQKPMFSVLPNEAMGNYDLCRNAASFAQGTMKTRYCTVGHNRGGVCVPHECTGADLHNRSLMQPLMNLGMVATMEVPMNCVIDPYLTQSCSWQKQGYEYFHNLYNIIALLGQDTPGNKGSVQCEAPGAFQKVDSLAIFMMFLSVLFVSLALVAWLWNHIARSFNGAMQREAAARPPLKATTASGSLQPAAVVKSPGGTTEMTEIPLEEAKDARSAAAAAPQRIKSLPAAPGILAAWDLHKNWHEVFTLKTRAGEFACFDSLKAISAAWVVFYHVILWQIWFINNPEYLVPPKGLMSKWWATPFFNYSGTLSVDTFFFISGFLAAYMLMIKLDKDDAKGTASPAVKWVPMLYLNRWLRITPSYAFSFFLNYSLAPLVAYGPQAKQVWVHNNHPCKSAWWKHMLYINNVYPWWNQKDGQACYGHSWYLANDMQFFLLVPFFVMLYRKGYKKAAIAAVCSCMLTCIIASWTLAIQHSWSPNIWDGAEGDRARNEGFSRPWVRCCSYMIGILFSFYWYHKKQFHPDHKFSGAQVAMMWLVSMTLMALAMYGPYSGTDGVYPCNLPIPGRKCGSNWTPQTKAAIISLLRPTWTLGVALMCLLCWNNQGGIIQTFLSAKFWFPLSMISFAVYLVHFTVLTFYVGQRTMRIRWEFFDFIIIFFGLYTISSGLGLAVVLFVEKPFIKLQKILMEGSPKKKTVAN